MRASKRLACVVVVALGCITAQASSQSVVTRRPLQRFFFRAALGMGYGAFTTSALVAGTTRRQELSIAGFGGMGNFALGVSIIPRLAVHIDACAMSLVTPTITIGETVRAMSSNADSTSTVSIIGGGVTWHTPVRGLWTSLSGGVAVLGVEIPAAMTSGTGAPESSYGLTQLGWGLNLLAGWEWRLVHHWRLGVAFHGIFASIPDAPVAGDAPTWTALGGGVSLTVHDR